MYVLLYMSLSQGEMAGYGYYCDFVEPPPDALLCQICLFVARAPVQMDCCGKVYCKACLNEHKKYSTKCPNCREVGNDFPDLRGKHDRNDYIIISMQNHVCSYKGNKITIFGR